MIVASLSSAASSDLFQWSALAPTALPPSTTDSG